jgi:hypothetical protein
MDRLRRLRNAASAKSSPPRDEPISAVRSPLLDDQPRSEAAGAANDAPAMAPQQPPRLWAPEEVGALDAALEFGALLPPAAYELTFSKHNPTPGADGMRQGRLERRPGSRPARDRGSAFARRRRPPPPHLPARHRPDGLPAGGPQQLPLLHGRRALHPRHAAGRRAAVGCARARRRRCALALAGALRARRRAARSTAPLRAHDCAAWTRGARAS